MGRIALVLTVVAVFVTTRPASADIGDTLNVTFNSATTAQPVTVTDPNPQHPSGSTISGMAGVYNWTYNYNGIGSKPSFVNGSSFTTFCLEVTQDINYGHNYNYTIKYLKDTPSPGIGQGSGGNGMGNLKATQIQNLFDSSYSSAFTKNQAAAFQLAIWEIIFEPGSSFDANAGTFKFASTQTYLNQYGYTQADADAIRNTAGSTTTAGTMLYAMSHYTGSKKYDLVALSSDGDQDQVAFTPVSGGSGSGPVALPEPGVVLLGLSGLGPLAAVVRFRRRLA